MLTYPRLPRSSTLVFRPRLSRQGQPSTHTPFPSWAGAGGSAAARGTPPGSPLLTRPGSSQTGPRISSSDPNRFRTESPFSPKPRPCCSQRRNRSPAFLRPLCQPGPRALARSSRGGGSCTPPEMTPMKGTGATAPCATQGVPGAHHHSTSPLPVTAGSACPDWHLSDPPGTTRASPTASRAQA